MWSSCGKKMNIFTTKTKNGNVKKKHRYQNEVIKIFIDYKIRQTDNKHEVGRCWVYVSIQIFFSFAI